MSEFFLQNPPLICVAARVFFAPVENIANYIPSLQDALRLDGYPLAHPPIETKSWRVNPQQEAGMNVTCEELSHWDFSNSEKTVTIRIDKQGLTLLFTDYNHFSNAEPHYKKVLTNVGKTITGLLPQMFGLRYIAHIPLGEESPPTDWVTPSVLGVPNCDELPRQSSVSETSFQPPDGGQLVMRCMSLPPQSTTLPADLLPLNAELKYPLRSETPFILLENLHQRKAKEPEFSAQSCLNELSDLRKLNAQIFRATVTKKAIESWK